jgi:hypothetical protein
VVADAPDVKEHQWIVLRGADHGVSDAQVATIVEYIRAVQKANGLF